MNKLTLPPRPVKRHTEADIEAMIARGGAVAELTTLNEDAPHHINARLTKGIVRQIDVLRAQRPRKPGSPKLAVSQQDWILEAVLEKLKRDKPQ